LRQLVLKRIIDDLVSVKPKKCEQLLTRVNRFRIRCSAFVGSVRGFHLLIAMHEEDHGRDPRSIFRWPSVRPIPQAIDFVRPST
jgi:hypothetical protein